ncbi:MAG: B12-binding domain-containing protein, partial [Phycisphaerales bacterium]
IRHIGAVVVHPGSLGLTDMSVAESTDALGGRNAEALYATMERGDAVAARAIIQSMYLNGTSVAQICDGPIRECMARVGQLWLHQEWGIAVEHRATDLCLQALSNLRWMLPQPAHDAPVALGGACDGDPYILPSLMAAVVACECGFRDVNLGATTPISVLMGASAQYEAKLVWIAVSVAQNPKDLRDQIGRAATILHARGVPLAVGGRGLNDLGALQALGLMPVASMTEFAAYARGLKAALVARPPG